MKSLPEISDRVEGLWANPRSRLKLELGAIAAGFVMELVPVPPVNALGIICLVGGSTSLLVDVYRRAANAGSGQP